MGFPLKSGNRPAEKGLAVVFAVVGLAGVQAGLGRRAHRLGRVEVGCAQGEKQAARLLLCHLGEYPDAAFLHGVQGCVHAQFHENRSLVQDVLIVRRFAGKCKGGAQKIDSAADVRNGGGPERRRPDIGRCA